MKLVTFLSPDRQERVGILSQGPAGDAKASQVIDAQLALEWLEGQQATSSMHKLSAKASDMVSVIREQKDMLPAFRKLIEAHQAGKVPASALQPEKEAYLLSPIPRPASMRDGYAFRQHVEAARRNRGVPMIPEFDQFPVFYFTNHLAVTGPGDLPVQKLAQEKLDFELEVAIVIGKEGRNIPAGKADEHVFGYMIMNDWSARHLQMEEMKLNLGPAKGKDFATSLGPWLVTRDELAKHAVAGSQGERQAGFVGERHDLKMRAFVNGKQLSFGNVKDMNWTFAQIIERASYGVTLHPGEVIGSGTVGTGCLLELNGSKITDNLWLKPGDKVVMEVDGLGRLENTILDGGP